MPHSMLWEKIKINNDGMAEINKELAESAGVDFRTVDVCRKIRRLAKLDRIEIEKASLENSQNETMLKYVEYCGAGVYDYFKRCLSNLQPFMIEKTEENVSEASLLCTLDNAYKVTLAVRKGFDAAERVIIAFYVETANVPVKSSDFAQKENDRLVPVFTDCVIDINPANFITTIKVFVQKGMMTLPIQTEGLHCGDVFIVKEQDIGSRLTDYCVQYIRDLYTSNVELDYDSIGFENVLKQTTVSFYGEDTFLAVSLLIDSIIKQRKGPLGKIPADFALVTFVENLRLNGIQQQELIHLITEKYKDIPEIEANLIIWRVTGCLF